MAVIEVDFTNVPEGGWLTEGQYQAEVEECNLEVSQRSGSQYLKWKFRSVEPETYGQASTLMTSLSEKALWKLRDVLKAIGVTPGGPLEKVTVDTDKYVGKRATIHVVNEPYEGSDGNTYNSHKIANVYHPVAGATAQAAASKDPVTPVGQLADPTDPGISDDDIPF